MRFTEWLFGGINNPVTNGRWGLLHILTLVLCAACIVGFYFLAKRATDPERVKRIIVYSLAGAILFFEIMIRFVHCIKLYYYHQPEMNGVTFLWILIPKPWCAISCWALIACVFVKKAFFYNYAALSALLCSVIFFAYPGVGYNNQYILFENLYSIVTHALLLTTSITLIVFQYTEFKFKEFWKFGVSLVLTFAYGLLQIYVLKTQVDPMYFMPNGDIQGILGVGYGVYLFLYIALIVVYVGVFYGLGDKESVKKFFATVKEKFAKGKR